jgi:hypothetical protein
VLLYGGTAVLLALALGVAFVQHRSEAARVRGPSLTPVRPQPTLEQDFAENRLAYIPPQCFTRLRESPQDRPQNPCYVCHADAPAPNQQSHPELQLAYDFPEPVAGSIAANPWHNLFVDRRAAIRSITDEQVLRYVGVDNYGAGQAENALAGRLLHLPPAWDRDGNGRWDGYVPDAFFHFDAAGFDRAPDGTASGWRAFAYYPLPGAFLPTNGSFDDVLIRLPEAFREDREGRPSLEVYALNLAIVEVLVKGHAVAIERTDERPLGEDLDGDGSLGWAMRVAFRFRPGEPLSMHYVGAAARQQVAGQVHLAPGLFPEGTEFLHSVRYLAIDAQGVPAPSPRMKELRYARKHHFKTYSTLIDRAQREAKEEALDPDRPDRFFGDAEHGLSTDLGWAYQGFIEDPGGQLRPQTYEETLYCMGCHANLSATDDGAFAFGRKREDGPTHGYSEMGAPGGGVLPDPLRADGLPEYATYLRQNRAGDEYRANDEVLARFFDEHGAERADAFARLAADIGTLLLPSRQRALALDKAYWLLVREQSFAAGRDALLEPAQHVLRTVPSGQPTGVVTPVAAPRLSPGASR